jgi:antitoxin HigA-1
MRVMKRQPTHPGEILKDHYLIPLGLTVTALAKRLGVSRKTVSKIINEGGNVVPDMALRLSRAFGTTPEFWLNLQRNCDLWRAYRRERAWRRIHPIFHSHHEHAGELAAA